MTSDINSNKSVSHAGMESGAPFELDIFTKPLMVNNVVLNFAFYLGISKYYRKGRSQFNLEI